MNDLWGFLTQILLANIGLRITANDKGSNSDSDYQDANENDL